MMQETFIKTKDRIVLAVSAHGQKRNEPSIIYKYIVDRGRAVGVAPPRTPCSLPHKARLQ
jgi:hypothetical protein